MTPDRIKEIFMKRGYEAAREVASATQEPRLLSLVHFLRREEARKPRRPGATARAVASGKAARRLANRAARDAACRARKGGAR